MGRDKQRFKSIQWFSALSLFFLSVLAFGETFKNPQWIKTNSNPYSVVEADLNGDGKPDIVYADNLPDGGHVHVLLNQGGGAFTPGQDIVLGPYTFGNVAIGDVNGDGIQDLVIAISGNGQGELGVALGNGDGTFSPLIYSSLGHFAPSVGPLDSPATVRIADLNGDGVADVVLADPESGSIGHIVVCIGDNAGHFQATAAIENDGGAQEIFVGDYNGDGKNDLIVHDFSAADAAVYLNNGDGTFKPGVLYDGPQHISSIAVTDIDGDGHPDMVVTGFDNAIAVLHGNPDGTFTASASIPIPVAAQGMPFSLLDIQDYNGDGALDLALQSRDGVHILLGKGNLAYKALPPAPVSSLPSFPAIGDLNQDGMVDFAFPVQEGIAILYGQPGGSLHSADAYDVGYIVSGAALSDFNDDGNSDIAAAVDSVNPRILLGKGDGTFALQRDTNTSSASTYAGNTVDVGDFNGDGKPDLLLNGSLIFPPNIAGASYQLGKGDGTFGNLNAIGDYSNSMVDFVAGDLNNDGLSDIVINVVDNSYTLLSRPGGSFGKALPLPQSPLVIQGALAFGDFNRDGKRDFAFVGNNDFQVELGNGDGTFHTGYSYLHGELTASPSSDTVVADLDGDGNLDIAANAGQQVEIFYGRGDGSFENPQFVTFGQPPSELPGCCLNYLAAADFNRDGLIDLALSNGALLTILHGTGHRTFGAQTDYLAGDTLGKPLVGDFNHDGYPDIALANLDVNGASTITVLLNIPDAGNVLGALTANPEPSAFGSPFSLGLTINGAGAGSSLPTGNVAFTIDGIVIGSSQLNRGTASLPVTSSIAVGDHVVSAQYGGDATYRSSAFTITHTVSPVRAATRTAIAVSPSAATVGMSVILTASVASDAATPNGAITFYDGGASLGSATLSAGAIATLATSALHAGAHTLTASYTGNSAFLPSTSPTFSLLIGADATSTTLTVAPNPAVIGAPVTLAASVAALAVPLGTVTFYDGASPLGTGAVDGHGNASVEISSLALGVHSISASYAGTPDFNPSTSSAVSETILAYAGDFSIGITPPTTALYTGEAAKIGVVLAPSGGWNQDVTLSCGALPANATCAFTPATIAGANGASSLAIQTAAPHRLAIASASESPLSGRAGTALLASLALLFLPRRLRWRKSLCAIAVLSMFGALNGCGAPGPITGGTPPGAYNISVTAIFSKGGQTVIHSSVVKLTVKTLF